MDRSTQNQLRTCSRIYYGILQSYLRHSNLGPDGYIGRLGGIYLRVHRLGEPAAASLYLVEELWVHKRF